MNLNEQYYRKTVSAIGFTMLIFLLLFNVFGLVITLLLPMVLGAVLPHAPVAYDLIYQLSYAAGYTACFMVPVIFLKMFVKRAGYSYRSMYSPLKISPWLPLILLSSVSLVFVFSYLNSWIMEIFGGYPDIFFEAPEAEAGLPTVYHWVLEFIVVCMVPGFCEEFLFRGAILTNCLPFGRSNAILISSLLFSLMHQNPAQILYTFAAGILLGIIYERTGSIWNCVLLHIFNNFVATTENLIYTALEDSVQLLLYIDLLELVIFFLGILSAAVLILRFFSKRERDFSEGFFGRELPSCDGYSAAPVAANRVRRLFWAPSMIAFVVLVALQVGLILLIAMVM
ncbi:MAG: CPBP family intramembrane metalloprotease [Clostridia bacterium]|nr:CPBP family intramembrane metalloprotease [Clostridia bacterium]